LQSHNVGYLIYKHRTFLGHKISRVLPNATVAYCKGHNHVFKRILNKKVGYRFCQVTVAQPEWNRRRRGHSLNRYKLAQIFAGALYQFSPVRKPTEEIVGLRRRQWLTTSLTESSRTKLLTALLAGILIILATPKSDLMYEI